MNDSDANLLTKLNSLLACEAHLAAAGNLAELVQFCSRNANLAEFNFVEFIITYNTEKHNKKRILKEFQNTFFVFYLSFPENIIASPSGPT